MDIILLLNNIKNYINREIDDIINKREPIDGSVLEGLKIDDIEITTQVVKVDFVNGDRQWKRR